MLDREVFHSYSRMNRIYRQVEPTYMLEQNEIIPVELSSAAGVLSIRMKRARSLLLVQLLSLIELVCPSLLLVCPHSSTTIWIGLAIHLYIFMGALLDSLRLVGTDLG